jgi:tRNA nucleotidyltransferase (CCA-adding enzyme)
MIEIDIHGGGKTLQLIMSHVNTDFDALASMVAAKKLYPHAQIVISTKQNTQVKQFLTIYRETLDFIYDHSVDWTEVEEIILVDAASLTRIGNAVQQVDLKKINFLVYDHHPPSDENVTSDHARIEAVGATVTLLIEEMRQQKIPISPFEATLFGLGIYTDTGSFTYPTTTVRDFEAGGYLLEQGMNVEMIQRFADYTLYPEQQELLNQLFLEANTYEIDGLELVVSSYHMEEFLSGLNLITEKLLELTAADGVIAIVKMKKHVYLVGRGNAKRITLLPLLERFGGGGHEQAGSATVRDGDLRDTTKQVTDKLELLLKPATTARDMMSSPVKTLEPETKVVDASKLMYQYGHSGYPVAENGKIQGIITRRDLDKAIHSELSHAPVKAYMRMNPITIDPETTIEEIQKLVIKHNIGRLPVIKDEELLGIITRTDIIEWLHRESSSTN